MTEPKVPPFWPFKGTAPSYLERGWHPLPIYYKDNSKRPLVSGFTGRNGAWTTEAEVSEWSKRFVYAKVGIRLPFHIIGIDIDSYSGKQGEATIQSLEKDFGYLPPTISSSSRDGLSGIYLFKVPPYVSTDMSDPGPGVDLIRWNHRFVMAWPSIHPRRRNDDGSDARYLWRDGDGTVLQQIPTPDEVSVLPDLWLKFLMDNRTPGAGDRDRDSQVSTSKGNLHNLVRDGELRGLVSKLSKGNPCIKMETMVSTKIKEVSLASAAGGCHAAMRDGVWALVANAAQGHSGLRPALKSLMGYYLMAMADNGRRSEKVAQDEFLAALYGALLRHHDLGGLDPCSGSWEA